MKEKVKPICVSALIALVVTAAICLVMDDVIRFVDGFLFELFIFFFIVFSLHGGLMRFCNPLIYKR